MIDLFPNILGALIASLLWYLGIRLYSNYRQRDIDPLVEELIEKMITGRIGVYEAATILVEHAEKEIYLTQHSSTLLLGWESGRGTSTHEQEFFEAIWKKAKDPQVKVFHIVDIEWIINHIKKSPNSFCNFDKVENEIRYIDGHLYAHDNQIRKVSDAKKNTALFERNKQGRVLLTDYNGGLSVLDIFDDTIVLPIQGKTFDRIKKGIFQKYNDHNFTEPVTEDDFKKIKEAITKSLTTEGNNEHS